MDIGKTQLQKYLSSGRSGALTLRGASTSKHHNAWQAVSSADASLLATGPRTAAGWERKLRCAHATGSDARRRAGGAQRRSDGAVCGRASPVAPGWSVVALLTGLVPSEASASHSTHRHHFGRARRDGTLAGGRSALLSAVNVARVRRARSLDACSQNPSSPSVGAPDGLGECGSG